MRDGRLQYVGPDAGAPDPSGAEIVDASGATIVPGLVDCHAHFTGLGGANWIARFDDPDADLLARGQEAARFSRVRTWISSGLPSGPITVVCRERYMLNLGMAT